MSVSAMMFIFGACLLWSPLVGCAREDCASDDDCPAGRACRMGLCSLETERGDSWSGEDGTALDCATPDEGALILNEILVDPPAGADLDGNGTASPTGDEFVEIVNVSSASVSLSAVQLRVGSRGVGLGARCLGPNEALVLFGSGGLPGLANGGGTVSLVVDDRTVDAMTYGAEAAQDASLVRSPEMTAGAPWVLHTVVAEGSYSPGTCAGGEAFPGCAVRPLPAVDVAAKDLGDDATDGAGPEAQEPACHVRPRPDDLVINELLADPGGLNDTNGDGFAHPTEDEFVEVVNVSGEVLLVQHMSLVDAGGRRVTIGDAVCLAPDAALVFVGRVGAKIDDARIIWVDGGGGLSLNNDGDTVRLVSDDDVVLAEASYGREGDDAQSLTRTVDLDPTGALIRHTDALGSTGARMSPGRCVSGDAFPDCGPLPEPDPESTAPPGGANGAPCAPPGDGDLIIHEVLVDADGRDFNGDGEGDASDAFIEIVNAADRAIGLGGVTLKVAGETRYTFAADCLAVGEAVVVIGGQVTRPAPAGARLEGATVLLLEPDRSSELSIALVAEDGAEVDRVSLLRDGVAPGQSWTRQPDCTREALVAHPRLGSGATSIGRKSDGDFFSPITCRFPSGIR